MKVDGIEKVCAIVEKLGTARFGQIAEQLATLKPKAVSTYCRRAVERGALVRVDGLYSVGLNWQELSRPRRQPQPPREKRREGRPLMEVDEKRVQSLREQGYSLRVIGRRLGVSASVIVRILKEPITARPPRPKPIDLDEEDEKPLPTGTGHRGIIPRVASVWELGAALNQI